jgi:starch phosphorylase
VRVELYADGVKAAAPVRQEMKRVRQLEGSREGSLYRGVVSAVRPPADYTPRATPRRAGIALPLEDARIAWQR